jgi:hypothetical protein
VTEIQALEAELRRRLQELEEPCDDVDDCVVAKLAPVGCADWISKRSDPTAARNAIVKLLEAHQPGGWGGTCTQGELACVKGRCTSVYD